MTSHGFIAVTVRTEAMSDAARCCAVPGATPSCATYVLHVSYERMLADPLGECRRIAAFLGAGFDVAAAAAAVDPSQRRYA